jgi:hypothetical protein
MEVCPLSRGMMLPCAQSLSTQLQGSFRFFHRPLPAVHLVHLAVHLPLRENYGLTTFHIHARMG